MTICLLALCKVLKVRKNLLNTLFAFNELDVVDQQHAWSRCVFECDLRSSRAKVNEVVGEFAETYIWTRHSREQPLSMLGRV